MILLSMLLQRCRVLGLSCVHKNNLSANNFLLSLSLFIIVSIVPRTVFSAAATIETCLECHSDQSLTAENNPKQSLFVDKAVHDHAAHAKLSCIQCHVDANSDDFPHASPLKPVVCDHCHKETAKTYFETYHGKASRLGSGHAAKCSDCHGSHEIYPVTNSLSTLSPANRTATCKKCHPKANPQFANYIAHASLDNKEKYPILFYTYWAMNLLLIGVFSFFGIHTLLWFHRSLRQRTKEKKNEQNSRRWVRRFAPFYSILHLCVIVSFLSLAITGMTLKFSYQDWAHFLSKLMGGIEASRIIHRIGAIITFGYFAVHIVEMFVRMKKEKINVWRFLFLQESMIPTLRDLKEFWQNLKWFFGKGPQPRFGRWTYWEKFDYFAVFWGVAIIGLSGLVLWFPEAFTLFLPGWIINMALIIHSDEALLAVGFIFTIHFFNTHFRPEKFPMDTVIFSGKVPLETFKEERPREYEQMVKENRLEQLIEPPPSKRFMGLARSFGAIALAIGIILIGLVIWTMVHH